MNAVKQILFPTDLSDFSHSAFPFACALAKQWNARLEVLHVMPPLLYEEELDERNHPDAFYAGANEALDRFIGDRPDLEIERRLTTGKAGQTIAEVAADSEADLIVLATHGKSGLARLFLGSVSEEVLRDAACPVLCIKNTQVAGASARGPALSIRTILCPIDFSDSGKVALDLAFTLAREQQARVILLHVASLPDMAYMGYGSPGAPLEMNDYLEDMRGALRKLQLPDSDVAVERRLEEGNPADVIVEMAQQTGADLIAMGTHGYKGLTHALMGSVAEHVVRKSTCPVLTFRGPRSRK